MFQFNTQSLFVGGAAPYNPTFESIATRNIEGIQSAQIELIYPRQDEFSWDGNGDRLIIERPRANLSFTYIPTSGTNEVALGFVTSPTISALSNLNTERNYYLLINQGGQDLVGYSGWNNEVLALGNGVLRHFDFRSTVGQLTNATVAVEGLNLLVQTSGTGQVLPAILKQAGTAPTGLYTLPFAASTIGRYSEASPANIVLSFETGSAMGVLLSGQNSCPLQSFEFNIDIPRQDMKDMGWAYPDVRPAQWPISINMRADAYLNAFQLDSLNRNSCDSGYVFNVGFQNGCNSLDSFGFQFVGAKLDSQTFVSQIGSSSRVSFNWSMKIVDPQRSGTNFYIIPSTGICYNSGIFPQVNYETGASELPLIFAFGTCALLNVVNGAAIISGNQVLVPEDVGVNTIRITEFGTSNYQDITITVG